MRRADRDDDAGPPGSRTPDSRTPGSGLPDADVAVLDEAVLVLNRSWAAIATTTVRHAMSLVCTGAARFVQPDTWELHDLATWIDLPVLNGDVCLRTPRWHMRVPQVLVLTRFNGMPVRSVTFSRRNIMRRDDATCQYCGAQPGVARLTIDHVLPRARGGRTTWSNCVVACVPCNRRKGDRRLEDVGLRLLRAPAEPGWTPVLGRPPQRARSVWIRFVAESQLD